MIKFRLKEFSSHIISDAARGASFGAAIAGLGSAAINHFKKNKTPENKDQGGEGFNRKAMVITGGGLLVGAALGALVGAARDIGERYNRSSTVDNRMMGKIVDNLRKDGFREGVNFTRDPKKSNDLKTKVCIVTYKYSDDLKILINTTNDYKLKTLTEKISKNVPNGVIKTNNTSDRFNEINISTVSAGKIGDAALISDIAESFIRANYPVYLVEVG